MHLMNILTKGIGLNDSEQKDVIQAPAVSPKESELTYSSQRNHKLIYINVCNLLLNLAQQTIKDKINIRNANIICKKKK